MTTVVIRKKDDKYQGFYTFGHADYAEEGYDIICSAISILVINTMNAMEEFTKASMEVKTNEETGFIDVRFRQPISSDTELLLKTMILGLESIRKQYGKKYLLLKFEEV